jgi:hypothetical protein
MVVTAKAHAGFAGEGCRVDTRVKANGAVPIDAITANADDCHVEG